MATRLTEQAKSTLRGWGVTQAAWLRAYPDCDRCGCSDDRCIGYHHDDEADCFCLGVLLSDPYWRQHHPSEIVAQLERGASLGV